MSVMAVNERITIKAISAIRSSALAAIACLSLAGCVDEAPVLPSNPAKNQAEAGTVLVSPTMVAPWDEVSSSLKPNFALTGDQAAAQVLPTTESISQQVLNAFGASLAAGLSTTSVTSTDTTGGTSPGVTSTTQTNPGVAPTIANTLPSAASLPSVTAFSGTLGLDPVLKYKAANYLLQEVQLLNLEIDNTASRTCYVPYVVKLKLAVMNFRPGLPYSAHSHIGFYYNGSLASRTQSVTSPTEFFSKEKLPLGGADLARECQNHSINPAVIPFLVADDVQVAMKSRAAEAASQVAFGLSALVHGAGISANATNLQQALTAISNHDLTSTLTVGRESENSLYALITPNNQASNQASIVSQTYDVAVLLLIPRAYFGPAADPQSPTIAVSTFTEYRDATTGKVLDTQNDEVLAAEAERIIPPHLTSGAQSAWKTLSSEEKTNEARRLALAVSAGDPSTFQAVLDCKAPSFGNLGVSKLCEAVTGPAYDKAFAGSIWTEAASFLDYDTDKYALFQAQLPAPIVVPSQQALLSDDGSSPIQVILGGVNARSISKVSASLNVTPFDTSHWKAQTPFNLPAQALTLDTTAHTLSLTFPSLKKLGIDCLTPSVIPPEPKNISPIFKKHGGAGGSSTAHSTTSSASSAGIQKVKTANKHGGTTNATSSAASDDKATAHTCPTRSPDAGSAAYPNGIRLQLVSCDPQKQLCPFLTDTVVTDDEWGELAKTRIARLSGLATLELNSATVAKDKANDTISRLQATGSTGRADPQSDAAASEEIKLTKAQQDLNDATERSAAAQSEVKALTTLAGSVDTFESANATEVEKRVALSLSPTKAREKALADANKILVTAREDLAGKAELAYVDGDLTYAKLGVSLSASPTTTNPTKVTLTNASGVVQMDSTAKGQLILTVAVKPVTDTVSVNVTGASLLSIVDSSNTPVSLDPTHGFVITKAGIYMLNLTGLNETKPIVLTAQALNGSIADGGALTQTFQAIPPRTQGSLTIQ